VLEELFLDHAGNRKPQLAFLDIDAEDFSNHPLALSASPFNTTHQNEAEDSPVMHELSPLEVSSQRDGPRKRRRVDEVDEWLGSADGPWIPPLPAQPLLEAIIEAHFHSLHHWMPILHETRFRAKLKDGQERARLAVLLHALVSTSIKYVSLKDFGMTLEDTERQISVSRRAVMLNAMGSLSLENTQALVFLAFDYV
jgi:hypothetical protein